MPKPEQGDRRTDAGSPSAMEAMVESLQRTAGNTAVSRLLARDGQPRGASSDGDPLPPQVKVAGERRLGADLADVRVHTDASAGTYAESLSAEAVTVGRDVFMSARPGGLESAKGRKTLMHELVHTVQAAGQIDAPAAVVSSPGGAAEREASSIGAGGFSGALAQPAQVASAGVAHRKVAEEEEQKAEPMPDLLNPAPLTEDELKESEAPQPPKAGELGANEAIAYEINVMQPLRTAMVAIEQQEWETALDALQGVGMKLLDYQLAYEKRDPLTFAELMSARGWLGMVYQQLKRRMGQGSWSDQDMVDHMRDSMNEFERIEKKL